MKVVESAKATDTLAEYADRVSEEPVIVTVKGKPIAALVAIENADLETLSLSTNPHFLSLIEKSRKRQEMEGGITSQEMRTRLGIK